MTFLQHIAKTGGFRTASSGTLGGQGGRAACEDRRFSVAQPLRQPLHLATPAVGLPGDNTPRSYLAGDPWRGSGP